MLHKPLEYAFDDWTVGQFAKSLGNENDYQYFHKRGYNWKNIIDSETGLMAPLPASI